MSSKTVPASYTFPILTVPDPLNEDILLHPVEVKIPLQNPFYQKHTYSATLNNLYTTETITRELTSSLMYTNVSELLCRYMQEEYKIIQKTPKEDF